jgi:hypothetical protein
LEPDKSAALRDQLLSELESLTTSEAATTWAHRILGAKNSLTETDARRVEDAFQSRLAGLGSGDSDMVEPTTSVTESNRAPLPPRPPAVEPSEGPATSGVDKSMLALPEPRRLRDKDHLRFVAKRPCLICGRQPADAHHLRFAQHRALGHKVSDEFTVPLCRGHHREVHRCGDEAAWWKAAGLDPTTAARALWLETRPLTATSAKMRAVASITAFGTDKKGAKRDRPARKRGPNYKTNPIIEVGPE